MVNDVDFRTNVLWTCTMDFSIQFCYYYCYNQYFIIIIIITTSTHSPSSSQIFRHFHHCHQYSVTTASILQKQLRQLQLSGYNDGLSHDWPKFDSHHPCVTDGASKYSCLTTLSPQNHCHPYTYHLPIQCYGHFTFLLRCNTSVYFKRVYST